MYRQNSINSSLSSNSPPPLPPPRPVSPPISLSASPPVVQPSDAAELSPAWKFGINQQYREWFIRKLITNLKKHHVSTPLGDIEKQSIQCEEQVFGTSKDQNDYFQKVSTVLFNLEMRSLKAIGENSTDREASPEFQSQVRNQGNLVLNCTDQPRVRQNVLPCNHPNNIASSPAQGSAIHHPVFGQSSNFQNLSGELRCPMDSSEEYVQTPYSNFTVEQWHNKLLQQQMQQQQQQQNQTPYGNFTVEQWRNMLLQQQMQQQQLQQQQQQLQYLYELQQRQYLNEQQQYLSQPQNSHFNQQQINQTEHPYYMTDNLDPNWNQVNRELSSTLLHQSVLPQPEIFTSPGLQLSQPSIQLMEQTYMQTASLSNNNQAILPSNLQSSQLLGQQNSYRQKQTIFGQWNSRSSMQQTEQQMNHQNVSFQHKQFGTEGNGSVLYQHHNKPLPHGFQLQRQWEPSLLKQRMQKTLTESAALMQSQNATDQWTQLLQSHRGLQEYTTESGQIFVAGDPTTEEGTGCTGFYKKVDHNILEEIREIYQHLVLNTVGVEAEDPNQVTAAAEPKGTVINCSTKFPPKLISFFESKGWSPIWSLRLMIPPGYPNSSPLILNQFPITLRTEPDDPCLKARSDYSMLIRDLPKPILLKQMIRFWELTCQKVVKNITGVILPKSG